MSAAPPVRLLVSDIDGTLVTADKTLTPAAQAAVGELGRAGVAFTLISSRPPRGMAALAAALRVRLPIAGFNGGLILGADTGTLADHPLEIATARRAVAMLEAQNIPVWLFRRGDWLLRDPGADEVARERRTVGYDPIVVEDFEPVLMGVEKIVGASADHAKLAACEAHMQAALGAAATVARSQAYYLDVTALAATKGQAVRTIAGHLGVALEQTAVIGDMTNDVSMFEVAGLAIAMGQAPEAVKAKAGFVTASNAEEGFARAVREIVLPRAAGARA